MTSAQFMLSSRWRRSAGALAVIAAMAMTITGCVDGYKLNQPLALAAPYDHPQLWAVVPFNNESGVSTIRTDRIADAFTEQIEQVHGLHAVPVNRVILAMRRSGVRSIASSGEAMSLMNALGVDGLIVGTVTTYNAYQPMKLGAAIQLFARDREVVSPIDPVKEVRSPNERVLIAAMQPNNPVAQASGMFDATNHQVLMWLNEYSTGRAEPGSPYGKDKYLVSMELYTQFVAFRLIHDLLSNEQARVAPKVDKDKPR